MNIVVASDENYAPHLETLLTSIGENNQNIQNILIHIFDGGISENSKNSIDEISDVYKNISVKFYEITENIIRSRFGQNLAQDRSLSAFSRLFIPEIIMTERAIYLDVDAIVVECLDELYQINIDDFAIAGVKDTNPISRHRNVGLEDAQVYINSGMLLWNLEKCRQIKFVDQCIEFINSYKGNVDAMDQGTLNGVLGKANLIKVIHPRFNVLTSFFQLNHKSIKIFYGFQDYYSDRELNEATAKPVFIHFTPNMTTRPWEEHCTHPKRELYWHYRSKTNHSKKELNPDKRSIKIKILGSIYRHLPISIVVVVINFFNRIKNL